MVLTKFEFFLLNFAKNNPKKIKKSKKKNQEKEPKKTT